MNDACIVYYTMLGPEDDITKEYKYFKQFARYLMGPIKIAVFRLTPESDKKQFRVGKVEAGKPELRYYPNEVKGD